MRNRPFIIIILTAFGAAMIILASQNNKHHPTARTSTTTSSQHATTAPPPSPQRTLSQHAAYLRWYHGSGYTAFQRTVNDLNIINNETQAGDIVDAVMNGSKLEHDAKTAALTPPPVATGQYVTAMLNLTAAGQELSNDQPNTAAVYLQNSIPEINSVTAALNNAH